MIFRRALPSAGLLFVAVVVGCGEPGPTTVASKDGSVQLTTQGGMAPVSGVNPDAIIQVGNHGKQTYLVVGRSPKDALRSGHTLEGFMDQTRQQLRKLLQGESVQPTREKKINGMRTLQCEIRDPSENGATYLLLAVEGDKTYYNIIAWTNSRPFSNYKPDFDKTIASFQENKPAAGAKKPSGLTSGPTDTIPRGR